MINVETMEKDWSEGKCNDLSLMLSNYLHIAPNIKITKNNREYFFKYEDETVNGYEFSVLYKGFVILKNITMNCDYSLVFNMDLSIKENLEKVFNYLLTEKIYDEENLKTMDQLFDVQDIYLSDRIKEIDIECEQRELEKSIPVAPPTQKKGFKI